MTERLPIDNNERVAELPTGEIGPGQVAPWEEIAAGRYMPRRIRGSYRGRVLG